MAWSTTFHGKIKAGDKWVTWGVWDSTGATGGDIDTRMRICDVCFIGHTGSAVEANTAVLNETFSSTSPIGGTVVTVVCSSGDAGTWYAIGRE